MGNGCCGWKGYWVWAGLAALMWVLAGCATLDKDECINADWQSIGYVDGARGHKASRIASHRKACAKHGVAPDFHLYQTGRLSGLREWCTPRNGYRQGARGKVYNGVCPPELEQGFMDGYTHGKDIHAYAHQISRQEQVLKKMYADLDILEQELADMEDALVSPGISPRRRRQLLQDIRLLEADQKAMLNDIADMEHTLEDMRAHIGQLKANIPYQ